MKISSENAIYIGISKKKKIIKNAINPFQHNCNVVLGYKIGIMEYTKNYYENTLLISIILHIISFSLIS